MISTDYFLISFPPEVTLPSSLTCSASTGLTIVGCSYDTVIAGRVRVQLTFSIGTLLAGSTFQFKV